MHRAWTPVSLQNIEPSNFCSHRRAYPCTDQQPAEWLDLAMMQNDKVEHSTSGVLTSVAAMAISKASHAALLAIPRLLSSAAIMPRH